MNKLKPVNSQFNSNIFIFHMRILRYREVCNLPKAIQLVSDEAGIQTQVGFKLFSYFYILYTATINSVAF